MPGPDNMPASHAKTGWRDEVRLVAGLAEENAQKSTELLTALADSGQVTGGLHDVLYGLADGLSQVAVGLTTIADEHV